MMTLPGVVRTARPQDEGVDLNTRITPESANMLASHGLKFIIRYLSRGPESSEDLTAEEALIILGAGLSLMPVLHPPRSGWIANADVGAQHGRYAAENAQAVGFPKGVNVWCDLEGIGDSSPSDVINYCESWYAAVSDAGYSPGLYVGANAKLGSQQLYELSFKHYWKSASDVPDVSVRGYQMTQSQQRKFNGLVVDFDHVSTDREGGRPIWLAPAAPSQIP